MVPCFRCSVGNLTLEVGSPSSSQAHLFGGIYNGRCFPLLWRPLTALLSVWIVLGHLRELGEEAEVEAAKEMDKRPCWPLGKGKKR